MPYQITFKRSAEKELDNLLTQLRERIAIRIEILAENPHPHG